MTLTSVARSALNPGGANRRSWMALRLHRIKKEPVLFVAEAHRQSAPEHLTRTRGEANASQKFNGEYELAFTDWRCHA